MKACPYCAEQIQDAAVVCKHCGRDLKAGVSKVQVVQPKKKTGCVVLGCAGILLLMLLSWVGSLISPSGSNVAPSAPPPAPPKPALTAEQIETNRRASVAAGLAEVKRVISDPNQCDTPKSIADAWSKLRVVKHSDPEWAEASRAVPTLEACRRKAEQTISQGLQGVMRQQRVTWAATTEKAMLGQGMEMDFTVGGVNKDRLTVKWALMGKAAVYKITDDGSMREGAFLANVQKIGFKRVEFTDGYDFGVGYTLEPMDEGKSGSTALAGVGIGSPLKLQ